MQLHAEPFVEVDSQEWDTLVEASPEAWFYHLARWVELEARYNRCRNYSFLIRAAQGKPLALMPLYLTDLPLAHFTEWLLHSGLNRHTGLAITPDLDYRARRKVQSFAIKEIFRIAQATHTDRIQLNAQNLAPANLPPHRRDIPFFVADHHFYFGLYMTPNGIAPAPAKASCNADQIIMLHHDEDTLMARVESAAMRQVRKAQRAGVEVAEVGLDAFPQVMALRRAALAHGAQTLMPEAYYRAIAEDDNYHVLVATYRGKPIGAAEILVYKSAATGFGGFGIKARRALGYNDLLQWQAILWSKRRGLRFYRLGPHFPDLPTDALIYRKGWFKKKFGGASFHILQGSYFLAPEKYAPERYASVPLAPPPPPRIRTCVSIICHKLWAHIRSLIP